MTLLTHYRFLLLAALFILCFSTTTLCQEVRTIEKMIHHRELSSHDGSMHSKSLSYKYQPGKKVGIIASIKTGFTREGFYTDPSSYKSVYKYFYDENGKVVRIKNPFLERKLVYDAEGRLKTILYKGKVGHDKLLTFDRLELIYDKKGRIVKLNAYNGKTLRSENSYQHHREENSIKRISTKDGEIKNIKEIHLREAPVTFNLAWYELIDPSDHRFELFVDLMFGFPSHIVCLSENAICDQEFTYILEENRLTMKHEWENNIGGDISNHYRMIVFHFMDKAGS